jgi:Protein of unknown function (DUF3037).
MTKRLACHYSVVRFCPYPETGEFVNVGVLLACPALGYLDGLRANLRRRGRVNRFFPELNPEVYRTVVHVWDDLVAAQRRLPKDGQMLADFDRKQLREHFLALTRPRESILYYGAPRVILSDDPAATLKDLFAAYVDRRFAHAPEYQEKVMCDRVAHVLDQAKTLDRYLRNEPVGDDVFQVRFPFVLRTDAIARPRRAIKALHLDHEDTTDLFHHADRWLGNVRRLRLAQTAPESLLFVLQGPHGRSAKHTAAFDQVRRDLDQADIPHVSVEAEAAIRDFATRA